MATAQSLLSIAAETLLLGATALYGYLFITGLFRRPCKLAKAAAPVPATTAPTEPAPLTAEPQKPLSEDTESTPPAPLELLTTPEPIAPTPARSLPDYEGMTNPDLIAAAKAARYPKAKKWSKSRPIGLKARQGAIAFLLATAAS